MACSRQAQPCGDDIYVIRITDFDARLANQMLALFVVP